MKDLYPKLTAKILDCLSYVSFVIRTGGQNVTPLENSAACERTSLLVALSGGSDSTALLVAMHECANYFNWELTACHINHNLRSEESDSDATFCLQLCEKLKIECQIISLKETLHPAKKHYSEEDLRELRYKYLIDSACNKNITYLVTGHTLDDQAETLLFRLFRGTSISGLKGIKSCRKIHTKKQDLYLVRPLLKVHKAQCQKFLEHRGIGFCIDSSNSNLTYTRNYIRHKVIPIISQRFSDFSLHLDNLSEITQAEDEYLNELSCRIFKQLEADNNNIWQIKLLQEQPLALQRRIFWQGLKQRSIEISYKRISQLIALISELPESKQHLNLNRDWQIKRIKDRLYWKKCQQFINIADFKPLPLKIPSKNVLPILNCQLNIDTWQDGQSILSFRNSLQAGSDEKNVLVDLSKIETPLVLRQRQAGDIIQPLGMPHTVKLKKYLHTHKSINALPFKPQIVLADAREVLWLPGIGLSEKIKVTAKASHILTWQQKLPD